MYIQSVLWMVQHLAHHSSLFNLGSWGYCPWCWMCNSTWPVPWRNELPTGPIPFLSRGELGSRSGPLHRRALAQGSDILASAGPGWKATSLWALSTYFSASSSWETPSRRAASRSAHPPSSHPASCCKGRSAECPWRGTESPPGGEEDHESPAAGPLVGTSLQCLTASSC